MANGVDPLTKMVSLLLILMVVLAGCGQSSSMIKEVDRDKLDQRVKSFVDRNQSSNGLYLYSVTGKEEYFIVNYSTARQGEKAKYIAGIRAQLEKGLFTIRMDVEEASDLRDERITPMSIYRIMKDGKANTIKVFINGRETPINAIGS